MNDARIIVALDYPDAKGALALVARLDPKLCKVKVGKELYTAAGPQLIETINKSGFSVFLDLKYHDIPNTVAAACSAAAALGVWMLNVHALGGRAMMSAAREAIAKVGKPPKLIEERSARLATKIRRAAGLLIAPSPFERRPRQC